MKAWHLAVIAGAVLLAVLLAYLLGGPDAATGIGVAGGAAAEGVRRFRRQRLARRRDDEARERAQHAAEADAARSEPLSLRQAERLRDEPW